jgi:hypothetical protein
MVQDRNPIDTKFKDFNTRIILVKLIAQETFSATKRRTNLPALNYDSQFPLEF